MAITLTPEQQAALDKFSEDAAVASEATATDQAAQITFQRAQFDAEHARQEALTLHVKALDSGQAFVRLLVPEPGAPAPTPAVTGKTK